MITFLCILGFIFCWVFFGTLAFTISEESIEAFDTTDSSFAANLVVGLFVFGPISFTIVVAIRLAVMLTDMFSEDNEEEDDE